MAQLLLPGCTRRRLTISRVWTRTFGWEPLGSSVKSCLHGLEGMGMLGEVVKDSMSEGLGSLEAERRSKELAGIRDSAQRMQHSYSKLFAGDLTTFETMLLFREFQRTLLGLRAYINYYVVIYPRLRDPDTDYSRRTLPIRGLFTDDPLTARSLYFAGVPTYYIRPIHTLNSETIILNPATCLSARMSFSCNREMRFGKHTMTAPSWRRTPKDLGSSSSLLERIECLSVANHALVAVAQRYDAARASEVYGSGPEETLDLDAVGPELPTVQADLAEEITMDQAMSAMSADASVESTHWRGELNMMN